MSLHELGGNGRTPTVTAVPARLTTRDVPMPLVKNLMALHESAAPGAVKGFAKSMYKVGLMEELLTDAVEPLSAMGSPSKRLDMKNPERVMEAFYAASFLQNEEAKECLVYSHNGKVVAMAQIGQFGRAVPGMECTISNLVVSPKLDAASQSAVIRHIATTAHTQLGEASLLTPEAWAKPYATHGFAVEASGPLIALESSVLAAEVGDRDPLAASIMHRAGVAPVATSTPNVVRCRWSA